MPGAQTYKAHVGSRQAGCARHGSESHKINAQLEKDATRSGLRTAVPQLITEELKHKQPRSSPVAHPPALRTPPTDPSPKGLLPSSAGFLCHGNAASRAPQPSHQIAATASGKGSGHLQVDQTPQWHRVSPPAACPPPTCTQGLLPEAPWLHRRHLGCVPAPQDLHYRTASGFGTSTP